MKTVLLILIIFHGLIHLMGFPKAFNGEAMYLSAENISKTNGVVWFIPAALFILTAFLFYTRIDSWWIVSFAAILLSQYLIFMNWQDAKFGTIPNLTLLVATIIAFATWNFRNKYENEVTGYLKQSGWRPVSLLREADIQHLPGPVKRYLCYTGAIGKPKVENFKIEFSGKIRKNEKSDWMPFTSEQYNFMEASTRLFFMKATMKHLPVVGFHSFTGGKAFMDIRLLGLFKVQYKAGKEMDIAETVTFFNDMCCMAPATLIDKRITWLEVAGNKVKAAFTNNSISISADLQFNDKGELINFISDDRYAASENNTMKRLRWLTPLKDYKTFDGHKLAGYAEAVYNYPEGDLCYGYFRLTNIDYNCKKLS